ncbi:MAG: LacI family DNA-binding transcriptional regulator [Chloroflexi bacterium]|nr:LacI family DNA-binding transcriptional regulator [Chloroflexota bacterium]
MVSPTSQDVAKKAGVSVATVSRVLNDSPLVSPQVRERVLSAVKELNYQPNRTAQRLRAGRSHVIGLIISDIQNPFFTSVVRGIEDVAYKYSYSVVLCNSDEDVEKEQLYIGVLSSERVAGVIIVPTGNDCCSPLLNLQMPVVMMDRVVPGLSTDFVVLDNVAGAYAAIQHLLELGHRRIGMVSAPPGISVGTERQRGYENAMHDYGIAVDAMLIQPGNFKENGGYQAASKLLELKPRPTAIFAANNLMTMGAYQAISDKGLRIPDDISVIGFDDMPWFGLVHPPLTAVRQPTYEIGAQAAELLFARLLDSTTPIQRKILQPELIVRSSTAAPARLV